MNLVNNALFKTVYFTDPTVAKWLIVGCTICVCFCAYSERRY